mgnify:CR=1 FL=1
MLNPFIPHLELVVDVASTQVQDLALGFVEPHEIDVISKFAEGALNPTVSVTDEDIEEYQSQH